MEILQVVGLGFIAVALLTVLKQQKPEIAVLLSIAAGVTIFLFVLGKVSSIVQVLESLARSADVNNFYLTTILKIVGIAYIGDFGAQVCRDAGESAIASKVEFAAKVLVLIVALPIVVGLLETITRLLP
ncbi:MAG: stage III sporulation protein AD [Bacillota bacterium]|jgi:stage III sporulation protein AD